MIAVVLHFEIIVIVVMLIIVYSSVYYSSVQTIASNPTSTESRLARLTPILDLSRLAVLPALGH